jgi:hypothetical protein
MYYLKKYIKNNLLTNNMNYNIQKYVGIFHLCGMVIEDIYGFIVQKNIFLDKLYIISFVSIPFSWIICKDECIISYIMKKIEDPKYILGTEPENVEDISILFSNKEQYVIFYNINNLLRICSIIIVNHRTTNIQYVILNQRRIKMAHFNSSGSDTSNDLKRAPRRGAVLNLHLYKSVWKNSRMSRNEEPPRW